ncbi:MAG: glycoside hydrolase family 13 [Gemmatimonadetes bacterium]|nr:MAG: glycoside hydrolase family 13 [Gemmatimonadota bacterium]
MNARLNAYLDGEETRDDLPPELRAEADAWDALARDLRDDDPGGAPPWMETAVMAEIAREAARPRREGLLSWLLRPRPIQVSPLTGLLAAAALAAVVFVVRTPPAGPEGQVATVAAPAGATEILVEFTLEAPGARSVAVSGDFNDWGDDVVLEDVDGDGVWTGRVPLRPGVHKYMFVIDGERWVTDPKADRYEDDGFGNRNAVLAVAPPSSI